MPRPAERFRLNAQTIMTKCGLKFPEEHHPLLSVASEVLKLQKNRSVDKANLPVSMRPVYRETQIESIKWVKK